jgi:sugar lactone lactonase YvrE
MTFGVILHRDGGLVVTGATGMHYLGGPGDVRPILTEYGGESLFLNDAIADAKGRVYAGTVFWGPDGLVKRGKLYLVDTDRSVRVVDEGSGMSNGLGFSPDGSTLYYTDSYEHVIWAFDVDQETGALANKRVFVKVPRQEGLPDGMTVDAEGNVWSACWFGGKVVCYDSKGQFKKAIELPIRQVASVMFGGEDLGDLYITSSSVPFTDKNLAPEGYDFGATNLGGAVYRVRPGEKGRIEHLAAIEPPPRA